VIHLGSHFKIRLKFREATAHLFREDFGSEWRVGTVMWGRVHLAASFHQVSVSFSHYTRRELHRKAVPSQPANKLIEFDCDGHTRRPFAQFIAHGCE